MLTCQQVTALVTEYTEGHMSLWRRVQFQFHLGMCRHCRAYVAQMKTTTAMLRQLKTPDVAPPLPDELVRRLQAMRPRDDIER